EEAPEPVGGFFFCLQKRNEIRIKPLIAAWPAEQRIPPAEPRDNFLLLAPTCAPRASPWALTSPRPFAAKLHEPTPCGHVHGTSPAAKRHGILRCAQKDLSWRQFPCWRGFSSGPRELLPPGASSSPGCRPISPPPITCPLSL